MKKGFTLMEMVVVISIIAILSGVILTATMAARKKGRDSRRKFDLETVRSALTMYYADHKSYPDPVGYQSMANLLFDNEYLENRPQDPLNSGGGFKYRYAVNDLKLGYELSAKMESSMDGANDDGNDNNGCPDGCRYEVGNDKNLQTNGTTYTTTTLCPPPSGCTTE